MTCIIIIIISGFGIYGAAVVPDSGVGNTWQRLTLVLHEFLSNELTPSRLHSHIISHTCRPRLPWPPTISGAWKPQTCDGVIARSGTLYVPVPPKTPSAKNSRDLVYIQFLEKHSRGNLIFQLCTADSPDHGTVISAKPL